jgi:hypothetical protein
MSSLQARKLETKRLERDVLAKTKSGLTKKEIKKHIGETYFLWELFEILKYLERRKL